MPGNLVLEGGAEFGGQMGIPDRRALELAGGLEAPVVIIPTAAAPDHNDRRAGERGRLWFQGLGAKRVSWLPLVDRASAEDAGIAGVLREARLIYLLGGFTHYLGQTLAGSRTWLAAIEAFQDGAVIAGSSAGAMVLCEFYFDPGSDEVQRGLGLIPGACVLPHHDTFGVRWAGKLAPRLPGVTLVGIDERTGMINDGEIGGWNVYGQGRVTLYQGDTQAVFDPGTSFSL
jgi:cyanophycinase